MPPTQLAPDVHLYVEETVIKLQLAKDLAKQNMARVQFRVEGRNPWQSHTFNLGNKVWLYIPRTVKGLTTKLLHRWHGPYRIVEQMSPVNFRLEVTGRPVPLIVHQDRLKPYFDPKLRPRENPLLDEDLELADIPLNDIPEDSIPAKKHDIIEEDGNGNSLPPDAFRVEKILKSRVRHGITEYLLLWQGYPKSDTTWEPEENILDPRLLEHFHSKQKVPASLKYIRSISVLSPQSPPRTYGLGAWSYVFLLISLVLLHFAMALHMGPLFDFSRLTQNKIYSLDDDISCDQSVTKDLGKFTQFKA